MAKPANKVFDQTAAPEAQSSLKSGGAENLPAEADTVEQTDFPCSVAQERFWLLDRLDPGNASFNVAVRWRLEGRVSAELLESAWLTIIERHEILRTQFLEVDGAPIQRVMARSPFRVAEIDLSALPQEQQQTEGERIGIIEARAPFDLGAGPLIRATLLRFSPTVAILLVTTHQIVSDGWSIGVMAREMGMIYEALRHDKAAPLDALPIQYADYSLWQLEWLRVRGTEAETTYWTKQLAGVKPFRVLPDRARPGMPTTNGAIVSRVLPRDLTNRAQALSAELGATLFASALAALCAALSRFTGEDEIVLGTQVSDRDQVELEGMIGQFVNSLILRNDVSGDPEFGELVVRVRDTSAQALEHRHIPIERLLGMVKGERSNANSPPISVNFIFQKTFIQNTAYSDFALIDMPSLPAGAIYDLNFFMVERPDGWRFSCQYNTDQFDADTAERLLGYVRKALESAVADPRRRVSDLELAAPGEAKKLLAKLNDTRALYPRELTLAKLFEAHVSRAPDSPAVDCDERRLTYAQLNTCADELAQYLRAHGVTPRSVVGVCVGRCLELPIALLAVLKAGATYLPLDSKDSAAFRSSLLDASKAAAVIVDAPWSAASGGRQVIDLREALGNPGSHPAADPIAPPEADAAACRLAVPGGDGRPSIIDVSHRVLVNLIYSLAKRPGVSDRDVVLATAPLSLDRATVEIFLPLLTGARLVIPHDRDLADGRRLLHLLQRSGATTMQADFKTWSLLMESGWIGYPALKMLCSVAELTARLADRLAATGGELWSLFGQTEAGICSVVSRVKPKAAVASLVEPIANTSLYVLDRKLKSAPVGATGELVIGCDGHADELYRTGALARLKAGGQIEFLGRKDHRFNHLGQLVDPRTIECILKRHPRIGDAAVLKSSDADGSLIALIVARAAETNADELIADVRASLEQSLPQAWIPDSILARKSLPHTASGDLDRRSLQVLKFAAANAHVSALPSGDIEPGLAKIWATMLKVESVDVTGNFFEMGGHSLLAARMLAQVESAFGRRIKLATLFAAPTIQELAKILAQSDPREFDFRQMVKVQPHGSKPPLIGINNTGIYYGLAKCLGADQPVTSLQLFDPSVRSSALPETLEEIAAGYVELICRVQSKGPYQLMGWCVAGALAFEIACQLQAAGRQVSRLYLIDSWVPRYLQRLPKVRGWVADYSLRWQLIVSDWRRVWTREQSFGAFVSNRMIVKRLRRTFGHTNLARDKAADGAYLSLESYDQWLLEYLQTVTAHYEPKMFSGKVSLLRSREEPTGWFFKEDAGWSPFTTEQVDVQYVDGNHFTMFKEPGVAQMARHISGSVDRPA